MPFPCYCTTGVSNIHSLVGEFACICTTTFILLLESLRAYGETCICPLNGSHVCMSLHMDVYVHKGDQRNAGCQEEWCVHEITWERAVWTQPQPNSARPRISLH